MAVLCPGPEHSPVEAAGLQRLAAAALRCPGSVHHAPSGGGPPKRRRTTQDSAKSHHLGPSRQAHALLVAFMVLLQDYSAAAQLQLQQNAAAPGVVVETSSSRAPLLHVSVDSLGSSYVVSVGGKPWLHSGALRFFVNGEWHGAHTTKPPQPAPICGPGLPHADIATGSMWQHFPNATDASCCAACAAAPRACNAWARLTAAEPAFPKDTCILFEGGRGITHSASRTAQIIDTSRPAIGQITGTLKISAPPSAPINGSDRFGSYQKLSVAWLATSSKGATTSFTTT